MSPTLLIETSRGCWWGERNHCTFCGLNGSSMSFDEMAPGRALELFDGLFAYGERVAKAYPRNAQGQTLFPFRRLFIVAQRKA